MTDLEYIVAFKADNQRLITRFYDDYRDSFTRDIGRHYKIHDVDLVSEIFQESVIRLWNNIKIGKLTESTLTSSLAGYLYSIGRNVALEIFRREGIRFEKSVEEAEQNGAAPIAAGAFDNETEREIAIRKAVYKMGEPCTPLLLLFYWDKLSCEDIAIQLSYKDANSAKTQKYKCIQKLKAQFINK